MYSEKEGVQLYAQTVYNMIYSLLWTCFYGVAGLGVGQHKAFTPFTQHFPSPQPSLHTKLNPVGHSLLVEQIGDVPFQ